MPTSQKLKSIPLKIVFWYGIENISLDWNPRSNIDRWRLHAPCSPNHVPLFDIARLSHVRLTVTDLDHTCFLFGTGLGLEVTEKICMHLFLCAIEEPGHRLLVYEKTNGTIAIHHPIGRNRKPARSLNPWR